jgi:hypothetical protein
MAASDAEPQSSRLCTSPMLSIFTACKSVFVASSKDKDIAILTRILARMSASSENQWLVPVASKKQDPAAVIDFEQ